MHSDFPAVGGNHALWWQHVGVLSCLLLMSSWVLGQELRVSGMGGEGGGSIGTLVQPAVTFDALHLMATEIVSWVLGRGAAATRCGCARI